jgi:hypothetical protein
MSVKEKKKHRLLETVARKQCGGVKEAGREGLKMQWRV